MTVIIECISWLINVTDNNDARWKPEINVHWHLVHSFSQIVPLNYAVYLYSGVTLYIHKYFCVYVCVCVCVYIYI